MAGINYPNSLFSFPIYGTGIQSGYTIQPYHVTFPYYEISGIEEALGLNPLNGWPSITERISGIESGYWNLSQESVLSPLFIRNIGGTAVLSGQIATSLQDGFLSAVDRTSFDARVFRVGDTMTGPLLLPVLSGTVISGTNYTIGYNGFIVPQLSGNVNVGSLAVPVDNIFTDELRTNIISGNNNLMVTSAGGLNLSTGGAISLLFGANPILVTNSAAVAVVNVPIVGPIAKFGVISGTTISGVNYTVRQDILPVYSGISNIGSQDMSIGTVYANSGVFNHSLGVGTSAPATKLHVYEPLDRDAQLTLESKGAPYGAYARLKGGAVGAPVGGFVFNGGNTQYWSVQSDNTVNAANLRINRDSGVGNLIITSTSAGVNLGIGIINPTSKLEVGGIISGAGLLHSNHINPVASGAQNIGAPNLRYSGVWTNNLNTANLSGFVNGIAVWSSIIPATSGNINLGSAALPFSGIYALTLNGATVTRKMINEVVSSGTNGTQKVFNTLFSPYLGQVELYQNGLHLFDNINYDYIVNSGNAIVMRTAPMSGSTLVATYSYLG